MLDYILLYLQKQGCVCNSNEEQSKLEEGILLFLKNHGIDPTCKNEHKEYFKQFVNKKLGLIDKNDYLKYLSNYKIICEIEQIIIETERGEKIKQEHRKRMYESISQLQHTNIDKYLPVCEIALIIGTYI